MSAVLLHLFWIAPVLSAVIPIQKIEPGTRYRQDSLGAPVKLEVFLDMHCPDSNVAWPKLQQVAEKYGSENVDLIVHQFPLPYHQHAHLAAQGFYLIRDFVNDTCALKYMDSVLHRWYLYTSSSTEDKTATEMKSLLADHAHEVLGEHLTTGDFVKYIDFYRNPAVYAWKYAVKRGVAGAPWYFVNGIDLGINHPLSYGELCSLMDQLLS